MLYYKRLVLTTTKKATVWNVLMNMQKQQKSFLQQLQQYEWKQKVL